MDNLYIRVYETPSAERILLVESIPQYFQNATSPDSDAAYVFCIPSFILVNSVTYAFSFRRVWIASITN
jgi:hypothetical protein